MVIHAVPFDDLDSLVFQWHLHISEQVYHVG